MNGVKFIRENGGLGRTQEGTDFISGLIIYGEVAVPQTLILSADELDKKGITSDTNPVLHYHASEFFRVNEGARLFVQSVESSDGNYTEGKTLQNFAEGNIKQLAVCDFKRDLNTLSNSVAKRQQLFKPTIYARVFVFDDGDSKVQQAKTQVQGGNHYLGFDRGVFQGVYPHAVINISHKINSNDKVQTTYNLENEIKRALPVGKRIFIQFVVQNSPTTPLPAGFATAKYAYCDFLNADDNAYPHYKIDLSDSNLGYQGKTFYYAN